MTRCLQLILAIAACLIPVSCFAIPAIEALPPDIQRNDSTPTTILARVVGHGAMVLGKEVGGARVTITDIATKHILATGIQQGGAGDRATFEAPFFVPLPQDAPDGITLRVIVSDPAGGNFGIGQSIYQVLGEHLRYNSSSKPR